MDGERNLKNVITVKITNWGEEPELSRWAQCNQKDSLKSEEEGQSQREMAGYKDGQRGRKVRDAGSLDAGQKRGNRLSPQPPEVCSPTAI